MRNTQGAQQSRYEHFRVGVEPYVKTGAYGFFALVWLFSAFMAVAALAMIASRTSTGLFSLPFLSALAVCLAWGALATFFCMISSKRALQSWKRIIAKKAGTRQKGAT